MPKGSRKKAGGKSGRGRVGDLEEEHHSDTISVTSSVDDRSVCDGSICGDQEVDDSSQAEHFEEKVGLALDGALDKSATMRTNSLLALCTAFSKKYVPDIVETRRMTVSDTVEKCLKKGKSAEVSAAADLAVLASLQLADVSGVELVYSELRHTLATLVANNAQPAAARAKCCLALAAICYLSNAEPAEVHANMTLLETVVFAACRREGAAPAPAAGPLLATAALQAWTLLVADVSHNALLKVADSQLSRFAGLLDSPDVDLRIAAGEAIVAVYELLWSVDDEFVGDDLDGLCAKLRELATDSAKSRKKSDRKQQRCVFRDILRTFEEDEYPSDQVKFGREVLQIDTWSKKHLYDFLASVLRSGTNAHLKENELVRAALGLGAPLLTANTQAPRVSKLDRMYQLNEATKCRQQARGKYRDKRTAIFD